MATLTPGELLGVLKENNAQLLTQISAIFSANSSPTPTGAQPSGNGVTGDQDMDDAWDNDDDQEPSWEDVLPGRGRKTRRDGNGAAVAARLANPPPLSAITDIVRNHVPYTALPKSAAPRRNRGDRMLHNLQRKIEVTLSLLIESQDDPGQSATSTNLAAAMLRSAWEDTNDMRRKSYAGGQSYKLDTREDFDNPRLLSPEEEQKIRAGRHKGKGKGKGKGMQQQQQQQQSWQPYHQRSWSQGGKGGRGKPWRSSSKKNPEKTK